MEKRALFYEAENRFEWRPTHEDFFKLADFDRFSLGNARFRHAYYRENVEGQNFNLEVDPSDTIETVKEKIRMMGDIPLDEQRLIFEGKCLENRAKLSDYNIYQESTIYLILRLVEGGAWQRDVYR